MDANAWIGIYDLLQAGTWKWTDAALFDFANWSPGQPDNEGRKEHCAALNTNLGTDPTCLTYQSGTIISAT